MSPLPQPQPRPVPLTVGCPKCGAQYSTTGLPSSSEVQLFLGAVRTQWCSACGEGQVQANPRLPPHLQLVTGGATKP